MVVTHISKISKFNFYDINEMFKEYNWHISEVYPPQMFFLVFFLGSLLEAL